MRYARVLWHPIVLIYVALTLITRSDMIGDTHAYVYDILQRYQGLTSSWSPLWDFGHVLWRPAGWLILCVFRPALDVFTGSDLRLDATLGLFAMAWCAGLICALLVFRIGRRVSGSRTFALFATLTFLCFNNVLCFTQSGAPYLCGLMFLLLACWVLIQAADKDRPSWVVGLQAGAALTGAICCWFPYLLMVPAVLSLPLLLPDWKARPAGAKIAVALASACAAGVLTVLIYAIPIAILHLHSLSAIRGWVASSGHGWAQNRNLTRLIFGLPRSFIYMAHDGILFKRYVFHDPYAPVRLIDLLRLTALKLSIFYIAVLALFIGLWRTKGGIPILSIAIIALFPLLAFAVLVFEAGSVERYLPAVPFLLLAAAFLWRPGGARFARYALVLFAIVLIPVDLYSYSWIRVNSEERQAMARIKGLDTAIKPKSLVAVANIMDDLVHATETYVFNPVNRKGWLETYCIAEISTTQILIWKREFRDTAFATWDKGGEMWITKRVLAPRPEAEWEWTEGDDRRIRWLDLYSFFHPLEYGESVGGPDGFVLLPPSPGNRDALNQAYAQESPAAARISPSRTRTASRRRTSEWALSAAALGPAGRPRVSTN